MLVTFRTCGPKDHASLLKFVIAYYKFDKIPINRKSLSQGLDVMLRNPSQGQSWLMESHGKPVGYAVLTYNFDLEYGGVEGMLTDLYVLPKFRKKGIGSLALYEIEDYCRERGIRTIELQLLNHNKSAAVFYSKAGFRTLPRKVLILDVRSETAAKMHRASAGKRR